MRYARFLVLQRQNEALGIELGHLALGQSLVEISRVQDDLALELLTLYLGQQDFLELLSHQQQSTIIMPHANYRNRCLIDGIWYQFTIWVLVWKVASSFLKHS
jgi:hypothetical protein